VRALVMQLGSAASWEAFVNAFRGRSYLAETIASVDHPATPLLQTWRDQGVPVLSSSPPWPPEALDSCVARGCHRSASEHAAFLREEMAEFIENKFWVALPYDAVKHLPNLQLSPAAVKEERDRKPRLLCDHSWYPVNEQTVPHSPPEAMQFGGTLHRVLQLVRHANPSYGYTHLCKHDIKDGYYRLFLNASDCPRLAIILPRYENETQLVAIPMACTMGWVESPPTFCTLSETITDEANRASHARAMAPPHRLEASARPLDLINVSLETMAPDPDEKRANATLRALYGTDENVDPSTTPVPPSNCAFQQPVHNTDVFVDDFIQVGQGTPEELCSLRRHLWHSVDAFLNQPLPTELRNEAVSLKKLLKGDGSWATRKLLLGWIVDTQRQTIELPAHRKLELAQIFSSLHHSKRVSNKRWLQVLGKLRFVALAIPGAAGLFSTLQWALYQAGRNRVRLTRSVRSTLDEFGRLVADLCARPAYLAEIVPELPHLLGATDAAKAGMGGVYFDHTGQGYWWREPFPDRVQRCLATFEHPHGTITNSDLEQAALLAQLDVMSCSHDTQYATLHNFSDNVAAVSRTRKGAVSKPGPSARLCQVASSHQRQHRYCHRAQYLPGPQNVMSDDCSRLQHLTPRAFACHLEQHYPQASPWQQRHLRPEMSSLLTSALLCASQTRLWPAKPATPVPASSPTGPCSAPHTTSNPACATSPTPKPSCLSSLSTPCAAVTQPPIAPASLCELAQWKTHSWPWARGSPHWVNQIPERKFLAAKGTIPYWLLSSKPSGMPTAQQRVPTLSTPRSFKKSAALPTSPTLPPSLRATSASLASSGSCAPPSTCTQLGAVAPKLSACVTSPSLWTTVCSSPPPRL
jgi:hypothetical protein